MPAESTVRSVRAADLRVGDRIVSGDSAGIVTLIGDYFDPVCAARRCQLQLDHRGATFGIDPDDIYEVERHG
jgi:hypothetical protein